MNNKQLVIIGAGGHAKVCYEIAVKMNQWTKIVILDDNLNNDFFEISGKLDTISNYSDSDFFVAIGDNKTRSKFIKLILSYGFNLITLISPSSVVSSSVVIDKGTVIMPNVVINAASLIGKGVIFNTSCTVDHDCKIDDYVHISPGANLAGNVHIGQYTWIGIGSCIIQNISIADNVIVGAGSVVLHSLAPNNTYIGSPANIL